MVPQKKFDKYISVVFQAAEEYDKYLLRKQFLFIGRDTEHNQYTHFETVFTEKHFKHLTGIKPVSGMTAERFFLLCKNHRLNINDVEALPEGQSSLKADVLLPLMRLPYTAKMMGDYNISGNYLFTEKLAGSVVGCMGFRFDNAEGQFIANTVLKEDIRDITVSHRQIVAVYQKNIGDRSYPHEPIACIKPLMNKKLRWPDDIAEKISVE